MSIETRASGKLLVVGLVVFFVGAAGWLPAEFQAPVLSDALRHVAERHGRWLWIHVWMAAGVLLAIAGLTAWVEIQRQAGERLATPIGVALFEIGAVLWLFAIAMRVTVQEWAARETLRGAVPAIYPALHRLMGALHGSHMGLSYVSFMVLGVGILCSGSLPAGLGWAGVVVGASAVGAFAGFQVGVLGMPFLALTYPCAIGVLLLRSGMR